MLITSYKLDLIDGNQSNVPDLAIITKKMNIIIIDYYLFLIIGITV